LIALALQLQTPFSGERATSDGVVVAHEVKDANSNRRPAGSDPNDDPVPFGSGDANCLLRVCLGSEGGQ
jgi:hypothetical protein